MSAKHMAHGFLLSSVLCYIDQPMLKLLAGISLSVGLYEQGLDAEQVLKAALLDQKRDEIYRDFEAVRCLLHTLSGALAPFVIKGLAEVLAELATNAPAAHRFAP